MIDKRWIYHPEFTSEQTQTTTELAEALKINTALATLLVQRGISDFEESRLFFRPDLTHLHDPFLMQDMDIAVKRLAEAVTNGEKILVYGDYDVDGTTSVTLFYGFLQKIYDKLDYYIPDRYNEGYGVSWQSIDWAQENGFTLIVTLDCGIKSVDKVEEAKKRGIDFIICDHHRPGDELPPAVAVLDPKRNDCAYPYKELTGCGVGFKFLQAYCIAEGIDQNILFEYLDLLVVSIAADIVPITGENRILSYYGLLRLNSAPRPGIKALIKIAGMAGVLDITNVVFGLGPRINAAGRIKHAKEAVRLLLSEEELEADEFAQEINRHNSDRKNFDSSITEEALLMIENDAWFTEAKSTVLYKEDWHKGVIGIVASRCIEKYHRPTIILTQSHGKAAGSARSVPGFDVYEAIEECADLLEQFGGHTFAAGLTLPIQNVEAFRKRFNEIVSSRIQPEQLVPMINIDLSLDLESITTKFYNILRQMGPFGPGNMTPLFESKYVSIEGMPVIMKEKHIKFNVKQKGSATFTAIGFGMSHFYTELVNGRPFSICYNLEENNFRDKKTLQLFLKDIKLH
ncbi:single-stranded-DNA-specific exonuclease RecJ [Dyadobacter psychrotolerans]|uniref:Single-stranded-DNA-specific exonuclease RecJ n=1 Tax=Dyadobacter psychrotolerans TaxID=2541721 RepID=A0A4R5DNM6_9BACT|nr:single-stranded-DNA-specific exonuclease RecJ [Dyadobacter psychrotolerans]TDE13754.1 single-stranded-DNA-specific exonuclease RecJ [Dyadobacter psychrotolerans]